MTSSRTATATATGTTRARLLSSQRTPSRLMTTAHATRSYRFKPCTRTFQAIMPTQARSMASISTHQNNKSAASASTLKKYRVVVIGGGSAGISVASQLANLPAFANSLSNDLLVIDKADTHFYQPLWTFVGAGLKTLAESRYPMETVIPKKADWVKANVTKIDPEKNELIADNGDVISYDFLVVAPGIQIDWGKIPGLEQALGKDGVSSNYSEKYVEKTAQFIKEFKGGKAIFTQPATPVKCAGAPQKIMYLFEESHPVSKETSIEFHTGMPKIFSVDKYASRLTSICAERSISVNLNSNLTSIDPATRTATFTSPNSVVTTKKYDFLHVTPPMSAPAFLASTPGLTNAGGWVNVDPASTRHVKYKNIYSCGDASSLPTSKTAAAAAAQSGVLVWNLAKDLEGLDGGAIYNGYTSCPLVTGKNKLIMAEFDYGLKPLETFPFDQGVERKSMYWLTADVIPQIYKNLMLTGRWAGPGLYRRLVNPFGWN